MAHIAMVSVPAHGHVNPNREIIRELVARGHRVTYANDPAFAEIVTSVGAELVPYDSSLPFHRNESRDGDMIDGMRLFLDDAIAMLPQLRAAYADDRPDLFLYDIAAEHGVPAVQLSSTYVAWEGYVDDVPEITEAFATDLRGVAYTETVLAWLMENGVKADPDWMNRPERCLVLVARALQPNVERVDPQRYTFVGPCLGERDHQGEWTRPVDAEKVLLVSLGSAFTDHADFYRRCVAAFGDLPGWHVVLQIGAHVDRAELGEVPASVEVHPWVPQLAILEQPDAFLTHAGMGGSSEGRWTGTPMIAAGVAVRVDSATVTVDELREALLQLTASEEVAARCAEVRRELREEGGVARAVELIEAAARP